MILANIMTYQGQCADAEHFYCEYASVPDSYKIKATLDYLPSDHSDLERVITSESEVIAINKKSGRGSARLGENTFKFNSVEQINDTLKEQFEGQNIVCYYEGKIFKGMLCLINGKNEGHLFFNEVFTRIPSSCYKDLIPENCIIRCQDCGKIYKLEEVATERKWGDRIFVQFIKEKTIKSKCCSEPFLEWNVVFEM